MATLGILLNALSGDDHAHGRGGKDNFFFGSYFTIDDYVDGGGSADKLILEGNYLDVLELNPNRIRSIETISFGGSYHQVIVDDGFGDLRINTEGGRGSINLDASALTTGSLHINAGNTSDHLIGSENDDYLYGGLGADILTGGLGDDKFVYRNVSESLSNNFSNPDLITDFVSGDKVILFQTPDVSSYHIGETASHAGDIIVSYDTAGDETRLDIFTDTDSKIDMTILLSGDHTDLSIVKDLQVIAG